MRFGLLYLLLLLSFATQAQRKTLEDENFTVGDVIEFPTIIFSYDHPHVLPESRDSVKAVADFLEKHPNLHLEIGNHTDSRGSAVYNLKLSEMRAKMVYQMLIEEFGIPSERLTYKGYGEDAPIIDNVTIENAEPEQQETYYRWNRRTEGLVTKI